MRSPNLLRRQAESTQPGEIVNFERFISEYPIHVCWKACLYVSGRWRLQWLEGIVKRKTRTSTACSVTSKWHNLMQKFKLTVWHKQLWITTHVRKGELLLPSRRRIFWDGSSQEKSFGPHVEHCVCIHILLGPVSLYASSELHGQVWFTLHLELLHQIPYGSTFSNQNAGFMRIVSKKEHFLGPRSERRQPIAWKQIWLLIVHMDYLSAMKWSLLFSLHCLNWWQVIMNKQLTQVLSTGTTADGMTSLDISAILLWAFILPWLSVV